MGPEAERILANAGWDPATKVPSGTLDAWTRRLDRFTPHKAARDALAKFGGLKVDVSGAGESMARHSFDLDPTLVWGEEDLFELESKRLGRALYPLGVIEGGYFFLAIADDGRVYGLGNECLDLIGDTIESALENMVLGRGGPRLFEGW